MLRKDFGVRLQTNKIALRYCVGRLVSFQNSALTSQASPNDQGIVIVVIIIVIGEAKLIFHIGGIIAQTFH